MKYASALVLNERVLFKRSRLKQNKEDAIFLSMRLSCLEDTYLMCQGKSEETYLKRKLTVLEPSTKTTFDHVLSIPNEKSFGVSAQGESLVIKEKRGKGNACLTENQSIPVT